MVPRRYPAAAWEWSLDGSGKEIELRNHLFRKWRADLIVFVPIFILLAVAEEDSGWLVRDDVHVEVIAAAVPRVEHLAVGVGAGRWDGNLAAGGRPDLAPGLRRARPRRGRDRGLVAARNPLQEIQMFQV